MYYCDKCGKPATFLTWVEINGERMEQHLCGECSKKEKGLGDLIEPMVGEFFDFPVAFGRKKPSKRGNVCPTCGYTLRDFLDTGYLNCPDCARFLNVNNYAMSPKSFDDTPMPIEKVKLNIKKPSDMTYVDELKANLQKAVNEERYQDAADLKKKIDEIEKSKGE